ncbi:hypothetical protein ARTSIC4J27_2592 [Pseudarthrobacter siccitolerans]|uniref:Uncharacterized protein n=1 Tax=Pseudarthrobacter siccitolerans TaxID=861266 RepID=A0A024H405_9MICC|nr:hypothetical protein ARTSIC4J27_2592 [Pseudarthrobacter siccitolerans]
MLKLTLSREPAPQQPKQPLPQAKASLWITSARRSGFG